MDNTDRSLAAARRLQGQAGQIDTDEYRGLAAAFQNSQEGWPRGGNFARGKFAAQQVSQL